MFQNDFYATDESGEQYLVDTRGTVLNKKANTRPKLVYGVGVNDWKYTIGTKAGGIASVYNCWAKMIERGYDEKYKSVYPTYYDVTVCEEWRNSFTAFFNDIRVYVRKGYHLDKDLLFFGNNQYDKQSCIFVPQWLNNLLTDHGNARGDLPQGVCWHKHTGKYAAQCAVDGKTNHLGLFNGIEAAFTAYINFKIDYIESKRSEIEAVALHNDLHTRFSAGFSLTDQVIENFKKQIGEVND